MTPSDSMADLLDTIDATGHLYPGRIAHVSGAETLTWGNLVRRSDALAGGLSRMTTRGAPVVLRGHKEPEMLIGFLGCAKAGISYVPIDDSVPEARAKRIIAAAGAELVLTPTSIRRLEEEQHAPPARSAHASTPLYVMFTSGSTGEPKGVVITRGCLDAFLGWMLQEQQFAPHEEVFLNQAIFSFDLSVMDTWCSLATGGTVVSLRSDDLADFKKMFAVLQGSALTSWVSTPAFAQLCLAEPRFTSAMLPRIRRFLFCGDVLAPGVARQLIERFPSAQVWNTYGPTEATVATSSVRVDEQIIESYPQVPVGVAMLGTQINIEDERGQPVQPGERGEIVIVGPNVSTGYLGREDLTQRVFSRRNGERAYRTGDIGSVQDGLLFFHGRMDSQVKIAGYRIELGDIESHLASLPNVRAAVVVAALRDGRPDSLHAFVCLVERPAVSELEIGRVLRLELAALTPAYMLPRKFHVLEAFPLTENGKTDRQELTRRASGE